MYLLFWISILYTMYCHKTCPEINKLPPDEDYNNIRLIESLGHFKLFLDDLFTLYIIYITLPKTT